jgi:hypothetical protein
MDDIVNTVNKLLQKSSPSPLNKRYPLSPSREISFRLSAVEQGVESDAHLITGSMNLNPCEDGVLHVNDDQQRFCEPCEIEIEARIRKQLVNRYTSKLLYDYIANDGIPWKVDEYLERKRISKNNRKCTYRQRDEIMSAHARRATICKSSVARAEINDAWCTMHVSIETNVQYMLNELNATTPVRVQRYRAEIDDHYIDIVQSEDGIRIEVEVCDAQRFDPSATLDVVRRVCAVLQGNQRFIGYYDWKTAVHIANTSFGPFCIDHKRYQKPSTMTVDVLSNIANHACDWSVTPKVDGVRKFVICANGRVYSMGTTKDVSIEGDSLIEDVTILDCELADNVFYVFDVPVYKGKYYGNASLDDRIAAAHDVLLQLPQRAMVKEYETFDTFDDLSRLYDKYRKNMGCAIDGMIFANTQTGYMQKVAKWKATCTVDLEVREDNMLYTCDGKVLDIEHEGANMVGVWEFAYDDLARTNDSGSVDGDERELTRSYFRLHGKLVAKRYRHDKPQANSMRIVTKNMYRSVPGTIFDGHGFYLMRKYHNAVKRQLIHLHNKKGATLMDIGTGQGGDILKWKAASKVYCVEPNEDAVKEMLGRLNDTEGGDRVTIFQSMLANVDVQAIDRKVDTFTAFFCMNQWADADWVKLEELIKTNGSKRCKLLAIAMTDPREYKSKNLVIKMHGNERYNIDIIGTRITGVHENRVSAERLTMLANKCSMKLKDMQRLTNDFMTRDEKALSAMYKSFVYSR